MQWCGLVAGTKPYFCSRGMTGAASMTMSPHRVLSTRRITSSSRMDPGCRSGCLAGAYVLASIDAGARMSACRRPPCSSWDFQRWGCPELDNDPGLADRVGAAAAMAAPPGFGARISLPPPPKPRPPIPPLPGPPEPPKLVGRVVLRGGASPPPSFTPHPGSKA